MDLVLNIGNSFLAGGYFEKDVIKETFHLSSRPLKPAEFKKALQKQKINTALIGSDNFEAKEIAVQVLESLKVPMMIVSHEDLSIGLDVEKPEEVGIDRIANTYGALHRFPGRDAIIVDMGTAVTFDMVLKTRKFIGGAIYPGMRISASALNHWTDKLPLVEIEKPPSPISDSTIGNIQSGIYYGLLGAIERLVKEMKKTYPNAVAVATGGLAAHNGDPLRRDLQNDLRKTMDEFEPELTLLGLHQILKERNL